MKVSDELEKKNGSFVREISALLCRFVVPLTLLRSNIYGLLPNTVLTRFSEVLNLHYIVNLGEKGLKIFTIS